MNGINFRDYIGFEKKWKLITVRYRKDSSEIRMIYANKIAARAFEKGLKVFPEGSILAKVAYLSEPDPAFESSIAPSQSRRFQFMVKNSQKYKAQNGWGYALFDSAGKVNPEPQEVQVNACATCHNIIPERDYVFSWPLNKSPSETLFKMNFETEEVEVKFLEAKFASLVPTAYKKVLKIKGALTRNIFQGTLDELKPAMAKMAVTKKVPVLFASDDQKRFTLVFPENLEFECDDEGAKGLYVVSVNSMLDGSNNKVHFCQAY